MRSDADRVGDILDVITNIKRRMPDSLETSLRDEMLQIWAIHHLQLIGETVRSCANEVSCD